jgi:hypothetical protein
VHACRVHARARAGVRRDRDHRTSLQPRRC